MDAREAEGFTREVKSDNGTDGVDVASCVDTDRTDVVVLEFEGRRAGNADKGGVTLRLCA